MSFSFAAVGTRAEVLAQLAGVSAHGNLVGEAARQLAADALAGQEDAPSAGYHPVYIVRASGHSGGGSPTSLNLTIEAQYVPDAAPAEPGAA
jgi:hypothetical protein